MAEGSAEFVFSVIIPLEFHRGQAIECMTGWTSGQTFPRRDYELILVCPPDFPEDELATIRPVLSPWDQLVPSDGRHDMTLNAEGARKARGRVLFFTESHCIPLNDTLERTAEVFQKHPDWAGFSGMTQPITHNFLSQIEGEFFQKDIRYNMEVHPWRKVLDPCFAVRREAYFQVGGFEAEYGHFAEWLLAGRLHLAGLKIGHAPEVGVRHFYIGELDDWQEFTGDFTRGEMLFFSRGAADPCQDLFDKPIEWKHRYLLTQTQADQMCRMMLCDLSEAWTAAPNLRGKIRLLRDWPWGTFWKWYRQKRQGNLEEIRKARQHEARALEQFEAALAREDRPAAKEAAEVYCSALVQRTRQEFLREWQSWPAPPVAATPEGVWEPGGALESQNPSVGFHELESSSRGALRWSENAAFVTLNIAPGKYRVTLEWHPDAYPQADWHRFYGNERPIHPSKVKYKRNAVVLSISVSDDQPTRIGWVCQAVRAPGDPRVLGLATTRITWESPVSEGTPLVEPAPNQGLNPSLA